MIYRWIKHKLQMKKLDNTKDKFIDNELTWLKQIYTIIKDKNQENKELCEDANAIIDQIDRFVSRQNQAFVALHEYNFNMLVQFMDILPFEGQKTIKAIHEFNDKWHVKIDEKELKQHNIKIPSNHEIMKLQKVAAKIQKENKQHTYLNEK